MKKKIVSITLGDDSLLTALWYDKQTQIVFGRIASIESGLPVIQLRLNMIKSKSEPHHFSQHKVNAMTACKVLVHMYESGQATSGKVNDDIAKALELLKHDEWELKEEKRLSSLEDEALKSVTIGPSVTSIGGLAFLDTPLTTVTFSPSVTSIGDNAFASTRLTTACSHGL